MTLDPVLAALFASAFLSATILPGNSEVALAAVVASSGTLRPDAIAVATLGNTLGGLTSYAIGRFLPQPATAPRALDLVRRYGYGALVLSFLPVIGDALCVASGWLRQNVVLAALAIAAGKLARYAVVAKATLALLA